MSEQEKQLFFASGNLISISEAAQFTPYNAEYLSLLARTGKLRAIKIARNWLTTQKAVQDYVAYQKERHQRLLERLEQSGGSI